MLNRYNEQLITIARKMATEEDLSFREIGRRLGIDNSTISVWCRGVSAKRYATLTKNNEMNRNTIKNSEIKCINNLDTDINLLKTICGIIYGCEGSKYPATTHLGFTNSEPELVSSFVNILRNCFPIVESKFRAHLQIHTNQNYNKLLKYWSNLLGIPANKFYKPTITIATGKKHRVGYLGTCTVRYYDYKIQLKLIGIYDEFMRKFATKEGIPNGSGKSLLNFDA